MAIKIAGTEVVSNARELKNIATVDSTTVSTLNTALNVDPTKGTLTKTFTQNETAEITLSANVSVGPVVSATKEVPQTGISSKGAWDVNSTASNYDFHSTAAAVTLTPSTVQVANVSLATYANKNSGSLGFTGLRGVWFKPDGTKMFTMDRVNAQIKSQNLSTAWDVSTQSNGSYYQFTVYISTSVQPYNFWFNSSGTKLYVNNLSGVGEFALSTAWDVTSISYVTGSNIGTSPYNNGTRGVFFREDGLRMYICGTQNNQVVEYHFASAFPNLSTHSGAAERSFATGASSARDVHFNSSGTTMYITDDNGTITEFSLSTAWDVSTASSTATLSVTAQSNATQSIFIGGGNLYVANDNDNKVYQYNFSQAGLVLGSGSFASSDVGKRIVGNGGDVILTSTGGAFSTTGGSAFTDSSTIAAGSWQMFGLKSAGDALGITISGKSSSSNYTLLDTTDGHAHKVTLANTYASGYQGFTIDPNGLYLFATDTTGNRIKRYDFGTAWDLSTLNTSVTSGQEVNHTSQDADPVDVAFNSSGTKMYIAGQASDYVYQWNLTTAWDLSTASLQTYLNVQGSSRVNGGFHGLFVTPDGTKFYTVCRNTDRVARWNMTNENVNQASFDSAYNVNSVNNYPYDIAWSPDGTAMYLSGNNSGFYKFNATTPFEMSSGFTHDTSFSVTVNTNAVEGFFIKPDETKIYTMYNNEISQWNIGSFTLPTAQYHVAVTNTSGRIDSSAFVDINSMTAAQVAGTGTVNYAVSTDGRTTWSVAKGTDGVRPIVRNNSGTWQYNNNAGTSVTTGFVLSAASYDNKSMSFSSQSTGGSEGGSFNGNGTKLYLCMSGYIYQYNLTTAYDLSTASYANVSYNFSGTTTNTGQLIVKSDNTKLWLVNRTNKYVYEFTFGTADDLSTLSQTASYNASGTASSATGLVFNSNGTKMYVGNYSGSTVYQFSLGTAWDVSTASYDSVNKSFSQGSGFHNIRFNSDGTKFFFLDANNDAVFEYSLSTAFNISTASYTSTTFSVSSQESSSPCMLDFSADGTKMFIGGYGTDAIYQYSTSSTSISYGTSVTWANGTVNDELYTLQQALTAQAFNRMDKTQLDAVADANHFPTGSSLDLMIALRMDAAASTLPTSDGVTLNYDSASLNEGAVLGTDYDFFHPAANKVQIKSLAAQNLKVRVV